MYKELKGDHQYLYDKFNIEKLISTRKYVDLRELKTYTIDDDETIEIDDAISIEGTDVIWIHIACPSESIPINGELAEQALKKACTIYNFKDSVYMFPKEFSENILGLRKGKASIALSLKVTFTELGKVVDYDIHRSIIQPNYKLTYEEADEILDYQPREEKELVLIHRLFKAHQNNRIKNETLIIDEPSGYFKKCGKDLILAVRNKTESRNLISEAMIIYNSLIAKYCRKNKIIIPFRSQSIPIKNYIIRDEFHLHINNYIIKQSLAKAITSVTAKEHYSLFLEEYTLATSPLRRYLDFLTHHQIISFLNQGDQFTRDYINTKIDRYNINFKNYLTISRSIKRTNIINWFLAKKEIQHQIIFLKWLNKNLNICLLYFEHLFMDVVCKIDKQYDLNLGDSQIIRIINIDRVKDEILISIIS